MLGLVIAGNIFQVFIFWELVGVCSYLLIGFYIERKSASTAANKAFIMNRVGDFGFLIGLMIVWTSFGTFQFADSGTQEHREAGLFTMIRGQDGKLDVSEDGKQVYLQDASGHRAERDGKPLYAYAREGVVLEREAREVAIHALELVEFNSPYLKIRVHCSKGTYIRVLGEDIGRALGCGAHLIALRRTGVGILDLQRSITLAVFTQLDLAEQSKVLLPVDALLVSLPAIRLSEELTERFLHGQRLPGMVSDGAHPTDETDALVRVYRAVDDVLLGVALLDVRGVLSPQRLVSVSASQ
jgi:hypothetical protein